MRPFDMLRACFLLLACVILAELATTIFAVAICAVGVYQGKAPIGSCMAPATLIREVWSEMLAAILALLLAAKGSDK